MKKIYIKRPKTKEICTVYIDRGSIKSLPKLLRENKVGNKYALITDSNIKKIFGIKLVSALKKENINIYMISFSAGEKQKNMETAKKIYSELSLLGIDRSDAIITLGGGVVGDIGGFIASTYLRGIPYLHIPTSLLAMTDSSISGKNGVNIDEGKNLVGTSTQPKMILMDFDFLKSLSPREIKNGLSEIVKHAVIKGKSLFRLLEKKTEKILNLEEKYFKKMLYKSIKIKKDIIEADYEEKNIRAYLNYGHTIGHGIEKASNYEIAHGEAVAIGMVLINKLAVNHNILKEKDAIRIENLLRKIGLPTEKPKEIKAKDVLDAIKHDKKHSKGKLKIILPQKIGKVGYTEDLSYEDIAAILT